MPESAGWSVEAVCPAGKHRHTLGWDSMGYLMEPSACPSCEAKAPSTESAESDQPVTTKPSRLAVWRQTRRARKALKGFKGFE